MSKRGSDESSGGPPAKRAAFSLTGTLSTTTKTNQSTARGQQAMQNTSSSPAGQGPKMKDFGSCAPDFAIAEFLTQSREMMQARGAGGEIEVEIRLGEITGNACKRRFTSTVPAAEQAIVLTEIQMREMDAKFVAGVSEQRFEAYKKATVRLSEGGKFARHESLEMVHSFKEGKRVVEEMDPITHDKGEPLLQIKEKLGSINIFLPHCPFDVRVAIAVEFPLQTMSSLAEMPSAAESQRKKDRTSVISPYLRVDLTHVTTDTDEIVHEVEVELKNSAVQDWLFNEGEAAWKVASEHGASIWNMIRMFSPEAGQAFKRKASCAAKGPIEETYRRVVEKKWNSNKFPGTMPVGLALWHLPHIRTRPYWISEKTDGVRYFLVVKDNHVALVDRTCALFTTAGLDLLSKVLPDGTVLDGEFVKHQREQRYIFLVFDVLATGVFPSTIHVAKPFKERLQVLSDFLSDTGPYNVAMRSGQYASSTMIPLVRKRWLPKEQLGNVFRQIMRVTLKTGEIARIYNDGKREHFTDGIVFCPNTSYQCGSHTEYLKWKWSDLITIDFLTQVDQNDPSKLLISCGGPGNNTISMDNLVKLHPDDSKKVQNLLQHLHRKEGIIEYAFDAETGLWKYKMHRPDKDRANYINTVLGSMLNLAEQISEEELQYRLLTHSDDWSEKMKRTRKDILHSFNRK